MERIIIACTPRTGSNLLQYSLATHPKAVSGGEWFEHVEYRNEPSVWDNKIHRPTLCNLLKVFSFNDNELRFNRVLDSGLVIYLHRENTEAQIASWQKACSTGVWRENQDALDVRHFSTEAVSRIQLAKELFENRASIVLSYEQLTQRWEDSIQTILQTAGWEVLPIAMKLAKQTF